MTQTWSLYLSPNHGLVAPQPQMMRKWQDRLAYNTHHHHTRLHQGGNFPPPINPLTLIKLSLLLCLLLTCPGFARGEEGKNY